MAAEKASATEARDVEGTRTDRVVVRIFKEGESVGGWASLVMGAPTFYKLKAAALRNRGSLPQGRARPRSIITIGGRKCTYPFKVAVDDRPELGLGVRVIDFFSQQGGAEF